MGAFKYKPEGLEVSLKFEKQVSGREGFEPVWETSRRLLRPEDVWELAEGIEYLIRGMYGVDPDHHAHCVIHFSVLIRECYDDTLISKKLLLQSERGGDPVPSVEVKVRDARERLNEGWAAYRKLVGVLDD